MKAALRDGIKEFLTGGRTVADTYQAVNELRRLINKHSPAKANPVDLVQFVRVEDVEPNEYNPNSVARTELGLLLKSIEADGYTQPIVTIWNPEREKYIIVDGFHRYYVLKQNAALLEANHGRLPVVVIEKDVNDRMASTIRHNRARGRHVVDGMASMIFEMLDNGWSDAEICTELGMEPEEILRLKHITGFSKLFANHEYNQSWIGRNQARVRVRFRREQAEAAE